MKILLRTLIAQFLDSADDSSHAFRRLYNIGVRGCRQFNLDITGNIKTVVLDVNLNKTASLPSDYIAYSKIGVLNGQGEVVTFKRNSQLSQWNAMSTQVDERLENVPTVSTLGFDPTTYPNIYFNYFWNGGYGNLYGADSGTATFGEYKVDEGNRVILLSPNSVHTQVVLEYLSDGYDAMADDYEIDSRCEEAFICYLRWQNAQDLRKKFSSSDRQEFKFEYFNELRKAAMRTNPAILSEMQIAARISTKLAPKA